MTRTTRISLVFAAAVVVFGAAIALRSGIFGESERPPNVVVLILDTVRDDAVGGRWGATPLTPNLDAIAAEGARFLNAYAPAPWTMPSHTSLFTGLYPHRHGAVHGESVPVVSDTLAMMAERLQERGFDTAGFTCNPWLHARGGTQQGFARYAEVFKETAGELDKGARRATTQAIDWLRRRPHQDKPFFLFVNYLDAHLPYRPPPSMAGHLEPRSGADARRGYFVEEAEQYIAGRAELSAADLDEIRRLYLTEVAYVDGQVADLVDHLRGSGQLDDTLLIITSDHGEHLGEQALLAHEFTVYEPALRIPLIVRHPGSFPAGVTSGATVSLVDVLPTVLDVLGAAPGESAGLQGASLLGMLAGQGSPERTILAEYSRPTMLIDSYWKSRYPDLDMSRHRRALKAVIRGGYKYIADEYGSEALYDLGEDPGETRNLAADQPERAGRMRAALAEFFTRP